MYSKDLLDYIEEHSGDDPQRLLLSTNKNPSLDIRLAVSTIISRQKMKFKNPEWSLTKGLVFPNVISTEQSSSAITARYKSQIFSNSVVVDLTGGLGVDSYFFSRSNKHVYYTEIAQELCNAAKHNFSILGVKNITILNQATQQGKVSELLTSIKENHTTPVKVYIDPSRRKDGSRIVGLTQYEPDFLNIKEELFKFTNHILVKISPMEDIKAVIRECENINMAEVISVGNECKELLLHLTPGCNIPQEQVIIRAVMFKGDGGEKNYDFTFSHEDNTSLTYCSELDQGYLYEPDAALLKAGAFKSVAKAYGLEKIARHTHLYISKIMSEGFPGRTFIIKEFLKQTYPPVTSYLHRSNFEKGSGLKKVAMLQSLRVHWNRGKENWLSAIKLVSYPASPGFCQAK
jgi:16S rRNA G966 N2-methylase RsmD